MYRSISDIIVRNDDSDILLAFGSIASHSARCKAVEQLVDLALQKHPPLVQHRCLLALARLLEEQAKTSPSSQDFEFLSSISRRTSDIVGLTPKNRLPRDPLDVVSALSHGLRARAAEYLREAILALAPSLNENLRTHTYADWSLRNVSVRTLVAVRLDLGMAGMSDIPPYSLERYGCCVAVPIRLNGSLPLEAEACVLAEPVIQFASKDLGVSQTFRDLSDLDSHSQPLRFHKEALNFFMKHVLHLRDVIELYSALRGGLRLETFVHLPVGTGLGVSSLLPCVIMKALAQLLEVSLTPEQLFFVSTYLENTVGIGGGWEDTSAIYPGVKLMEAFPEAPFLPRSQPLPLSEAALRSIEEHLVLLQTGIRKHGQAFFDGMIERYCLREPATLRAVERNNTLNHELAELLIANDLAGIGHTMKSQWENWKVLSDGTGTNTDIDRLLAEVEPYVYGARMNGAGQGGCAMLVVREGKRQEIERAVRSVLQGTFKFYEWEPVL